MDEELLKRNTDCVYFLASPFTCKKGAECEYRHSDMARLNPNDCWYWLSGSCLNPSCGFRHPPLEVHTGAPAEPVSSPNRSSFPFTKNNVPCYFYFSGYCNKGDKCSFLHGPEDISARKPNTEPATSHAPLSDTKINQTLGNKASTEKSDPTVLAKIVDAKIPIKGSGQKISSDAVLVSASPEKNIPPTVTRSVPVDAMLMQQVEQPVKYTQHGLASNCKETPNSVYESLNPAENAAKSEPSLHSDQSSEDQVEGDVVHDEWCESSPGFDVLVGGRSRDLEYDYDDGEEYMRGYGDDFDGCNRTHEHLDADDNYDNRSVYGRRMSQENGLHEYSYYSDDDEHRFGLVGYSHSHSHRDRELNHVLSKKRKLLSMDLHNGAPLNTVDLRDHLSKQRLVDGHLESPSFRRDNSHPFDAGARHERAFQRFDGSGRLHGRLASRLERNGTELTSENSQISSQNNPGRAKSAHRNSSRRGHGVERKRRHFSPKIPLGESHGRKKENEYRLFSGPKSLAEIRVEKTCAREDTSCFGRTEAPPSRVDFEGPKPLSEILKEKKRVG